MMLFSIIIPCYNQGAYLHRALNSLIEQRFSNWECIIVDDGSTDTTAIASKEYCSKDPRFKYFYKNNGGLSDARNFGMDKVSGDYIYFLDSDDRLSSPEALMAFVKILTDNPKIDVICANTNYEYTDGTVKESNQIKNRETLFFNDDDVIKVYFSYTSTIACNKLYKSVFLKQHNHKFIKGLKHEDELWSLQIFLTANQVVCIPYFTYNYYQDNPLSITTNISIQNIEDRIYIIEEFIRMYDNALGDHKILKISPFIIINRIRLFYGFLKNKYLILKPQLWMKYYKQVKHILKKSKLFQDKQYLLYPSWIAYIATHLVLHKNYRIPFLHRITAYFYKL